MTAKFDEEFEDDTLACTLKDVDYLRKAVPILDAHHLTGKERTWLWKLVKETWSNFGDRVTPALVSARLKRDFRKDDERRPYLELAVKLFRRTPAAPNVSLNELQGFVRFVNLQRSMEEAAKMLVKNDVEKATAALRTALNKDIRPRSFTEIKWIEDFEARQAERKFLAENPHLRILVPTGIKKLDGIIGGLQKGELGLVMGTTGRGKSVMLTNLGYHAIKCGYSVVHFSLEMPARQVAMRYDSRFIGMAYKKFKLYDFSPRELQEIAARVGKNYQRMAGKLRIVSMPINSCDINAVRSYLEDVKAEMDTTVVILDSADHLKSLQHYNDKRNEHAEVYWAAKGLAEDDGYAVWSSVHAGRDWATKIATAEATAESYDKARIADLVMSLNAPKRAAEQRTRVTVEDDDEPGVQRVKPEQEEAAKQAGEWLELFLAKYRDGESRVHIPLRAEFSRMLMEEAQEVANEMGDEDEDVAAAA